MPATAGRGALRQRTRPPLRDAITGTRVLAMAAVAGLAVITYMLVSGGDKGYLVHTQLKNAGGLRKGFKVRVDGVPVGSVTKVDLGKGDVVTAEARIDKDAAPLGRDARATVRAVNLLGEKYLDIEPGNVRDPAPSGVTIPTSRSGGSVELDDVIDTLDAPTRAALNVVLDEGGRALDGRGQDLADTVAALPSSLDRAGELLRRLSADNRSLGRLVDQSDHVVGAVAAERAALGRTVSGAAGTFEALASRSPQLGATVRTAPGTLAALRRALTALEGAAIPLRPAARGLRATAPALTATLRELPPTAREAAPALRAARAVAPALDTLGLRGTPVARRLQPLARQLNTFSSGVEPATGALDNSFADMLGVMEAWARATAPHDAAGHIFRLAVGGGADLLAALATAGAPPPSKRSAARHAHAPGQAHDAAPAATAPDAPAPEKRKGLLQHIPGVNLPTPTIDVPGPVGDTVNKLLDFLLAP